MDISTVIANSKLTGYDCSSSNSGMSVAISIGWDKQLYLFRFELMPRSLIGYRAIFEHPFEKLGLAVIGSIYVPLRR